MPYKFATQQLDYSDLASGRALYSLPGHPAFPIRLTSEIFQRCVAWRAATSDALRHTVFDPCCGSAYHLSTLAYRHWPAIQGIVCSDINPQAVQVAARNLALLTPEGLDQRIQELTEKYHEYGNESFQVALKSAAVLRKQVTSLVTQHPIRTRVFQASTFDAEVLSSHLDDTRVDIVLTDVPYGQHSQWQVDSLDPAQSPIGAMLSALQRVLHAGSIVAVASDKHQKVMHHGYERVEHFQLGKRQVVLLKPRP
jgi:23S rRNA (guanine2535-N1)-methyltransferase